MRTWGTDLFCFSLPRMQALLVCKLSHACMQQAREPFLAHLLLINEEGFHPITAVRRNQVCMSKTLLEGNGPLTRPSK